MTQARDARSGRPGASSDGPPAARVDVLAPEATDRPAETPVLQLHGLSEAMIAMAEGLALPALLDRIVATAADLVDAPYGALSVIGPNQTLEQFVFTGIDAATAGAIGRLPEGHGILGQLYDETQPVLLHQISDHPAAYRFPPDHPPMSTFLGVSVRVPGKVYGNLYLTEKRGGGDFTADDAELVQALAAAAGIAIQNARLAEDSRRKQRWLDALTEVRALLLSGSDTSEALVLIAARARELSGGDTVLLLLPDAAAPDEQLRVAVADGKHAAELRGLRSPVSGSIAGQVYRDGQAMSVTDLTAEDIREPAFDQHDGYGSAMFAPLGGPADMGVLVVANLLGTRALSADAVASTVDFAGEAALALRMDEARRTQRDLAILADRDRIARGLHDQVIQRLFATGMGLESITRLVTVPKVQRRVRRAVDDLDQTIRDIRGTIFELHAPADVPLTLRQQMGVVVQEAVGASELDLEVDIAGSVDAAVPPEVCGHALAVLREAVTNVARHAQATHLSVAITATDRLRIEVSDDGTGFPAGGRRGGLADLADRAEQLGGDLRLGRTADGSGALLTWEVPLPAEWPAGPVPA